MDYLIFASEVVFAAFVRKLPALPDIEGDSASVEIGQPAIEGGAAPHRCMVCYNFTEAQRHFVEHLVESEGVSNKISFALKKPVDWIEPTE